MHSGATFRPTRCAMLQVQRYVHGQHYIAHCDSDPLMENPRLATWLVYLTDVDEGGETYACARASAHAHTRAHAHT